MPLQTVHIGPMQAIYVGDYSDSVTPLTQILTPTTNTQRVLYNIQESFEFVANNSLPSGVATISADLQFLSDDANVIKLANGNWLDAANEDTPSTFARYTILLVYPDEEAPSSILIPLCYTQKNVDLSYAKNSPTTTPLRFVFQDRDITTNLYYKRTLADLETILGPRNPFA